MATTIPGGYYIGTDGQPHDANGRPVPARLAPKFAVETAAGTPAPSPLITTGPIGPVSDAEAEPAVPVVPARKTKRV